MYENSRCLTLRTIRYSDAKSLLTLWSDHGGYLTAVVPSGNSAGARRIRALTMPMSLIEAVVDIRPDSEMVRLKDARSICPASHTDGVRSVMSLFIADVFERVLRNCGPDSVLTSFVFEAARLIGSVSHSAVADLHLFLLFRLTAILGFEPDIATYHSTYCFDMREGRWRPTPPTAHSQWLTADEAEGVRLLSRLNARTIGRIGLTQSLRNRLLDGILEYYSIHHTRLIGLTSLEVVRSLF